MDMSSTAGETRKGRALIARRARTRRTVKRGAAFASTLAVIGAGSLALASPALAVDNGPGIQGTYGFIGALSQAGYGNVFCVDSSLGVPYGMNPISDQVVSYLPARPGVTNAIDAGSDSLGRMNYILSTYGQSGDPNTAAAAYLATDAYVKSGGLAESLTYAGGNGAVIALATQMFNESQSITVGGTTQAGSGTLQFQVDAANNYNGTVTMVGSAGATGTISLTNGVFVATGTNVMTGATEGTAYAVHGVPPTDDGALYKISGAGDFTVGGGQIWPGSLRILDYGDGVQRTAVGIGSQQGTSNFHVTGEDPNSRGVQFQPVVATSATTYVQPGQVPTDNLSFSTVADAAGVNNDWFKNPADGSYAPVKASGVLYGPFKDQPAESATVPADAPVAATATVTTGAAGPTKSYVATADKPVDTAGYYTWVWKIDWNEQAQRPTQFLIPGPSTLHPDQAPYLFTDKFGQVAETHIVPSNITAVSQITADGVALSAESNDKIVVSSNGIWNQVAGEQIPVVMRGTAYFVPGETAPAQQKATDPLPEGTVPLGSVTITVKDAGDYTPKTGIKAPPAGVGHITWVWKIDPADQDPKYQQMVLPWTDDFGVPAETQKVLQPEVSTKAQAGVKQGGTFHDTGIVKDTLPATGAELTFEGYKVPMVKDSTGKWVVDAPKADANGKPIEAGDLSWVCTDANKVFTNVGKGEIVTKPGEYNSPDVTATEHGKYLWVESLYSVPEKGTNEKAQLITQGKCGVPNETTFAVDVTTKAKISGTDQSTAKFGEQVWDTAQLTGYVPEGGSVEFEVHLTDKGAAPVCDASTLATTLKTEDGKPLIGGLYTKDAPLEVTSVKWDNKVDFDKQLYFVEVTKDATGRVVSRGECGDKDETVAVNAAVAAGAAMIRTDGTIVPLIAGGAGAVILIGAGVLLTIRRRNRQGAAE